MPEIKREKIIAGRAAVDAYRAAHAQLHSVKWHKGVSEAHTPFLNTMLTSLKNQGFHSLDEFFDANDLLNIQELGFASREDFVAKGGDREILEGMWH